MNRHEQSVSERDAFHPQDHTSRRQAEQLSAREQQANGHVNGDGKKPRYRCRSGASDLPADPKVARFAEHDSTGRLVPSAEAPEDVAPVVDEAEAIEDRRRRREAIKAKYKGQAATPLLVQALQSGNASASGSLQAGSATPRSEASSTYSPNPRLYSANKTFIASPGPPSPRTPLPDSALNSPPSFVIADDAELANANATVSTTSGADEPSAADYDPTMDMQEDRYRNEMRRNGEDAPAPSQSEDLPEAPVDDVSDTAATTAGGEMPPKPKASDDMFASDEEDDMFAPAPAKPAASEQGRAAAAPKAKELDQSLLDDWDDHEGYYRIILGELLDGRYHIQANLGKGMFSSVVRAMDGTTNELKAIKVIRNNETMMKAGTKEMEILQRLAEADPGDRKHLVRLERSFVHKGHLCMVFEHLSINLREVLKKFGRDVGINLKAVRSYAQQMFLGLALLRKCNILHADLKPDNILVNEGRNLLKICDLGSAADASENDITPYLVSRFYRAPEIILGIPYDFAIDMWSVGCTLFELYTGKILFTGRTNNQMLRSMMECRGKFSLKMLKKAEFGAVHFDDHNLNFRSMERDKITGKDVTRLINFIKPTRDLKSRLLATSGSGGGKVLSESELKDVNLFADLLDRCLALNPEKRITPTEALKHPFITRGLIK